MAFDPRHGDLVLFGGGFTAQQPTAETWTWDGTEWARAEPMLQQPPPAEFAAMADDPVSGALLLVTGDSAWSWDGTAWHQRARVPGAGSVDTEVLGLDSASGSDILVRDSRGSVTTWRWDGARWTELHPAHQPPAPEPEFPELIATDPVTGHPVLNVSTTPTADSPVSQTWTWDGADWTEQPQSSLGAVPLGLLSDSALGTVVALVDLPGGSTAETMAWIGERWVRIAGTEDAGYDGVGPTPRDGTGSAADAVSGRLLLVGGREFGSGAPLNPLGDTWTWTGAAWSRWDQAGPPPRSGGLLAPDPAGGVLLFGGFDQTRVQPALLDTWRWGAAGWTPLHPAVTPPPGSAGVGMATDSRLGATVLLTTCCSGDLRPLDERSAMQTWTWDGSTWTLRHPAHSPLGEAMLVDDPVRGRVLALVDEVDTADTPVPPELDTWAWDGTDWQDLHATTAGRFRGAAADPVTGDVVALSDPQEGVGGTQLFDGRGWLRRPLPDEPDAAALGTPMLVDPQLGRLVVLSGPSGELTEEWMWTGQAWVQLDLSRPPAAPAPAVPFHHGGYPPPP